jgi:hypothetical protein
LPQHGVLAVEPLLLSLRSASSLTREQRDQLPAILATIGPSTIPAPVRHLNDLHESVRAIAAAGRQFTCLPSSKPYNQDCTCRMTT